MPVHVSGSKGRFKVVDDKGKVHGTHASKAKANAQAAAINNSLRRKKTGRGFLPAKKRKR